MNTSQPPAQKGQPIAVHLAVFVAIALALAYVVNLAAVVMLPPRPPDVMRGDKVLDAFTQGFDIAKSGKAPPAGQGARWAIEKERPRVSRRSHRARFVSRDLARRLKMTPDRVVVAFNPTPTDVVVFRVRSEEFRLEHGRPSREDAERMRELHIRMRDAHREDETRGERRMEREVTVSREGVVTIAPPPPVPPASAAAPPEPPEPPLFAPPPPGVVLMSGFLVAAEMADGRWLVMRQQSNAETFDWIARAALAIGATLVILLLLALLFARRLAQPIQRFADAAQRVGVDPGKEPVKEEGPRELRVAARAVNAMQSRLRALVAERTEMLAAVAHDLRTPLMRLRLASENADPVLREKLAKETAEIDAMVASFIAFARDDPTREGRVRLDLAALVQSLVDDRAEAGQAVTFEGPDRLVITGQAIGLKRLVDNLIDNALKYGGVARVNLRQQGGEARIEVSDDGPGVPLAEREKVFRPFVRGDGAAGAGAGLGLAAAREIARAHGGDVEILDGDPRGALVRATLPV
ncbi:MAG: HAMP domain-containing protein [Hyphomonadaceae bacterium]|nr:HAMP domain-containing protein [Hyphomonadaceae bacterium]